MDRSSVRWRRAFSGAAAVWGALVPLATFAAARSQPSEPVYLFALGVYAIGSGICHQLPERSFFLWGRQLPVCARCTGIYLGAAVVSMVALVRSANASRSIPAVGARGFSRAIHDPKTLLVVAAIPAVATLAYEWTTGVTPGNVIRAVTGLFIGAAVAWVVSTR